MKSSPLVSVIVPMKDESANIRPLYDKLREVLGSLPSYRYEILFVDDGSTDNSVDVVEHLESQDTEHVRLMTLARNFGKEIATTAGLSRASGDVAIMIDADLQHPPELIPKFLEKWREGYDVVVGVQKPSAKSAGYFKRATARWYYKLMNRISDVPMTPHASDYRLLDRAVIDEFNRFTERNRMTRGLIDWLGFSRAHVEYTPNRRMHGSATYTRRHLIRLATNSIVSLSFFPLRIAGYLGGITVVISILLGILIIVEKFLLHDPFNWRITGTAMLADMLLFLVGIVLICQGLMSLYIANIHGEVTNRPLFIEKPRPRRQDDI